MSLYRCHCGLPLHYTNPQIEAYMNNQVNQFGEFIIIECIENSKKYKVQRHYIALHGLMGKDLGELGFEEIKDE